MKNFNFKIFPGSNSGTEEELSGENWIGPSNTFPACGAGRRVRQEISAIGNGATDTNAVTQPQARLRARRHAGG